MSARLRLAAALAAAALAAGCGDEGSTDTAGSAATATPADTPAPAATAEPVETATPGSRETLVGGLSGFDPQRIYRRDAPGVVTITAVFAGGTGSVLGGGGGGSGGQGSGFLINDRGEVATNAHVVTSGEGKDIRRASEVYVELSDGNRVEADIVGEDPNADIALLRIDPKGLRLRPLRLGSSVSVRVGQPVAAIGSPFGERQSLSVGVVSAVDRAIESLTDFRISGAVQTDAAINPGNSGGPLVNAGGEVIGVNQSIRTNSGGGEGVGFAVPVDTVKRSLDDLRASGKVEYAYLGVSSSPLYPQLVERFGLPVEAGAWVQTVSPGGPAAGAGIRGGGETARFQAQEYSSGGDVITRVDGRPVSDADDLSDLIARYRPGQEIRVSLFRDGKPRTIVVTLGKRPLDAQSG